MTHEEMNSFTNEELFNFSHLELALKRTELLRNLINDFREEIPSSVILKLEKVCENFIGSCEDNNIDIPSDIKGLKNEKHLTMVEIFSILGAIATILSLAMSIFSSNEENLNIIHVNRVINYVITEEYITNIDIVINELEPTYNTPANIDNIINDIDDKSSNTNPEN